MSNKRKIAKILDNHKDKMSAVFTLCLLVVWIGIVLGMNISFARGNDGDGFQLGIYSMHFYILYQASLNRVYRFKETKNKYEK